MTIKEIAKLANVSLGTVDRVIHNRGNVSPKTEKKILKILKEVNYKPNIYARGLVLNKSFTVAALLPTFKVGEYWEVPGRGVKLAEQDLKQFGISVKLFEFDQNSPESFSKQTQKVIELRPDGVILAPVINFEAVKFTKILHKLDIAFTIIDSNIKNSGALSFIGQDAYHSGKLAAKLLKSEIAERGEISIISIKNNENHNKTLQKRIEGFKDYFLESNILQNVNIREYNIHQQNKAWMKELKKVSLAKDLKGIFVPSSKVHFVAEILYDANMDIKLVGYDLIERNINYICKGTISYVIGQRPETQGYLALEAFYKFLVLKLKAAHENYLPLDIVTKENLEYYYETKS